MARVLVTGASGFLGRAAVPALRELGLCVHGVARTPEADVEVDAWHVADLLDPSAAPAVVRAAAPSHLLHLAWTTEHGRFWDDRANVAWAEATDRLLRSFAAAGGTRLVLAGSCAQYDWSGEALGRAGVAHEQTTPRRAHTLYGRTKQATAERATAVAAAAGVSVATGLIFFPYGPFDQPGRLIPSITRSLVAGEEAKVSVGTQVRDFVHVADAGAALAALVAGDVSGDVNIGTGRGTSVADVAGAVARQLEREELLRLGAIPAADDAPAVVADVGRLHGELGYRLRFDLDAGLRDAVEWWRERVLSEAGGGSRPAKQ
jgi:nucleoside-diphosphate-sugar epimerase